MMTIKCDICGAALDYTHQNPHNFDGIRASLLIPGKHGGPNEAKPFSFYIAIEKYQFNTTNFHVCATCVLKAVANRLNPKPS